MIKVKIVNKSSNKLPSYATIMSAGMDIKAFYPDMDKIVTIMPGSRMLIPTGLSIQLPEGYEAQIRPKSGNALKLGLTVLNTPGTIDADYRGEIGVIAYNASDLPINFKSGFSVAQMVIAKHETVVWDEVSTLDETARGEGGFGSTGK